MRTIITRPGAASVNLMLSRDAPFFQLVAVGNNSRCEIEFPHGSESFSSFNCKVSSAHYTYQLSLLQNALKALSDSTQTFLRLNKDGMLCLQHKLSHSQSELSFVEFIVLPEENQSENQAYSSADDNENGVERRYGENGSDETRREEDAGSSHQDDDLSFWDD